VPKETKDFYDFGPFRADTVRRLLLRDGQPVPMTSKVFDTLEVLIRNRDRVLEKEELLKEIWPNSFVEESNLTQNVSILRKALCELPGDRYTATVPREGVSLRGRGAGAGTRNRARVRKGRTGNASASSSLDGGRIHSRCRGHDLIAAKLASRRPQDLADVSAIQTAAESRRPRRAE